MGRRLTRGAAALTVAAGLVLGPVLVPTAPDPGSLRRDVEAAAALLADRDAALVGTARGSALTTDAFVERVRDVPFSRWSSTVRSVAAASADTLTLRVAVRYRLPGDSRDVSRDRLVTVGRAADDHRITADLPDGPARDLWDLGPVEVSATSRTVVLAAGGDAGLLADVSRTAAAAASRVDAAWGTGWRRRVVVVLPASRADASAVLGRSAVRGLDQMAAYTAGTVDPATAAPAGAAGGDERVVLVPEAYTALTAVGRRVVLTHELTHVAARAGARFAVPLWLQEGVADRVGYTGTGLPTRLVVGDALDGVRAGRVPRALPDATAFDPAAGDPAPAYAQAWVACELLAGADTAAGTERLVDVYRTAAGIGPGTSGDAAAALRAAFARAGTDEASFTAAWRRRLVEVAASLP